MKRSRRIKDYHLKGCMEGGFWKISLSGRNIARRTVWFLEIITERV